MTEMTTNETPSVDWWTTRTDAQLVADARALFEERFSASASAAAGAARAAGDGVDGAVCEGVWAAPGRVNLIGEHVDYAGGMSLPFALPQNTAAAVGRRSDGILRVVSAEPGTAGTGAADADAVQSAEVALSDIGPGNPASWAGYAVGAVWAGLQDGVIPDCGGLDIALVSDVPLGAGVSSSAALECSVALAAYELSTGHAPYESDTERLVKACIRAENEVVGASTGGLDQRSSFYGRPGKTLVADFLADTVDLVDCDLAGAGLSLLVINTNAQHSLADGQYASRRGVTDGVAEALGVDTIGAALEKFSDEEIYDAAARWLSTANPRAASPREVQSRVAHVVEEIRRTREGALPLLRRAGSSLEQDAPALGALINASHESLRDKFEVTVPELDCAQEAALAAGAYGSRMIGGGFGGSVVALVASDAVDTVDTAVATAAAERGLPAPTFFTAEPSAGARRLD